MKKKIGLKIFIPMIIALIVVIPMLVSGKDYGAEYDKIFGKEEGFTIHTNELQDFEEINDYQLMDAVQKFTSKLSTSTLYEGDSQYYYRPSILGCSAQDMTCDIIVQKVIDKGNWNYDYQEFKSYDDVKININSDVMNYFGTVLNSNGDMIINYDEAMFSDVNEKSEYISNYISSKQFTNSDGYNVSFYYEAPSNAIVYTINDYSRGDFTNVFTARARVKSVQFNSNEMPYTENYKKLTADGTLTIKSNAPITREILSDYLNNVHISVGGSYLSFNVDGKVVDGKAYVKMMQYGSSNELEWSENHLLTLVQDDKVDKNIFNMIGMKDVITIPADRPENELTSYIQYYFNGMQYRNVNLDDDNSTYYSFDYVYSSDGGIPEVVKFVKYVNGNAEDVQFNKISYNFTGYSDTYSDKFAGKYKNGMVVRADSLDFGAVSNNLDSGYSLLACNSDISVCDIALSHNEEKRMEIHKVNITLDDSISDRFKNTFNINDDGTIDILTDVELNGLPYVSYYAYDEENDFYFAMDTKNPDQIDNYRNEMKKHSMGMVLAEKDAYVYSGGSEIVYTYSQLTEGMPSETLSKAKLIERLQGNAKIELLTVVLGVILIANYPATLVAYALQILAVALAVYITGKIMIIKLNFKGSFSIATYSMVLSSIFSMVYTVINTFTEFRIVNFDLMYNIIIYIYAMFAVFMIKIDEMKQQEEIIKEVRKIEKVQEEVHEEMKAAKEVEEQEPEQEIKEEQEKSEETEKVESEVEEKAETKEESEEAKEVTEEKNENPIEKPSKKGKGKKK